MDDTRLASIDNFTSIHHSSGEHIETQTLPNGFIACILGAGQGIGEHIALAYAKAGVTGLVLAARTVQDIERVAADVQAIAPVEVLTLSCDVAIASSMKQLAEAIKERFCRLDVVVMNAGYAGPVTLKMGEGEPEWVQRAFDVNAIGTYHAAHYLAPMTKSFFAIGSLAGCIRRGPIANTGYCVSKMAQIRLVEMLAEQYDMLALTIHPGAVMTAMAKGNTPEEFLPYLTDDVRLCGAVCVWLSSRAKELGWLSGRLISANWDLDELMARRQDVIEKDLLKLAVVVS